ncbi:hypothetical protein BBP29_19810 [Alteromonas macleodii]|jgi:hypothetical protein|nr:hypothetical protein [Alteromonas macleodii]OZB95776.1 hypothetical protein BBP29_19810 [Alteromonas macleodii]|tara:strand:+ start:622 stop:1275 length:654 start_codon:yes stop_codon:yes gene_type:complete
MDKVVMDSTEHEDELGAISTQFQIPMWVKLLTSFIGLTLLGFCVGYIWFFLNSEPRLPSPKDLSITSLFIFSISSLIIVWVPWANLGVKITKIGGIEFKDIVEEQASEHAEEISDLIDRIELLESQIRQSDSLISFVEQADEPELRKELLRFLQAYSQWSFSPSRIKAWGSKQAGFTSLGKYETSFIRLTLQKMVAEDILVTRISKKGNTLYRVPQA